MQNLLTLDKSHSIKLIKTETIYEQPFYSPNIDLLSISENLYKKTQSPRKWIEKQETPQKRQASIRKTLINQFQSPQLDKNEEKIIINRAKTLFKQQKSLCMKKYFKIVSFVIIAILRLKKIQNQSIWNKYQAQYKNIIFFLKLELIQNKRINDWCMAVCARSLTSVTEVLHDFILQPQEKKLSDMSLLKTINACKFLMENLIIFTSKPKYFCLELKNFLFTQIFLDHKQYFTEFVSERTLYLHTANRKIQKEELTMILVESIILNSLLPNILQSNQTCIFFLKAIVSVINILFCRTFKIIKKKKQRNHLNFTFFYLFQKENKLIIERKEQNTNTQFGNLIQNLYDEDTLIPLFKYKKGFQKSLQSQFEKFSYNLYAIVFE